MVYTVDKNLNFSEIPKQPGCYIFRNKFQHIIYIGKSKLLYNRIKQHFSNANPSDYKHSELMKELHSIELMITDTETNALILECQLIKQHKPKYNSQLKREREYAFIRLNLRQAYPTLTITNYIAKDDCQYFGSFYDKDDAYTTLALINSIWQTPLCCKENIDKMQRPCLNYHLKKCSAPCGGKAELADYRKTIEEIANCLNGKFYATVSRLNREMKSASDEMNFERAAQLRDHILGLNKLKKKQKGLYTDLDNKDVYLFFRAIGEECFTLFFIQNGITRNRANFLDIQKLDNEKLEAFICDNTRGVSTIEDGAFLTNCLLEIGARKLFIPISRRIPDAKIKSKLEKAFKDFIKKST